MAEISDEELARLRGADKLLDKLLRQGKSENKRAVQKALKDIEPTYQTDDDFAAPYTAEIADLKKTVTDFIKEARDEKLEGKFQTTLDRYRLSDANPNGYTPEGIEKILTLMKERTIPDVEAGVALFERLNPPAPPPVAGMHPTSWGFGEPGKDSTDEDRKLLFRDEDAWAEREAIKVFQEAERRQ
jgi:hypothetical protein